MQNLIFFPSRFSSLTRALEAPVSKTLFIISDFELVLCQYTLSFGLSEYRLF